MKILFALLLLISVPALAQETEEITQVQSHRVTSVDDCISQLPPALAADVRQSLKPYEDCQRSLKKVLEKKATEKESVASEARQVPEAETPRNYVRVQTPAEAGKKPDKP